jgi:hypothetical protein
LSRATLPLLRYAPVSTVTLFAPRSESATYYAPGEGSATIVVSSAESSPYSAFAHCVMSRVAALLGM